MELFAERMVQVCATSRITQAMEQSFAELSHHPEGFQVRFERVYPHPIARVWEAVTDPKNMSAWFHQTELDLQPGGRIEFRSHDGDTCESNGRVVAVDPPRLFEFVWVNDDVPDELTRWELHQEGHDRCRVVFTHSRLAEAYAVSVSAGWHLVLDDLGQFLDGADIPKDRGSGEENAMVSKYRELWAAKFGIG